MSTSALRVAVVGSGPAGTYTAQALCDAATDVAVDVYERLPVPFGLVRYGVAPDHQKIKSVVTAFDEIYTDPRVRFIGNVEVGRDISIDDLAAAYSAVVVASGASRDRRLEIPGEDASGVWSATDFVAWYSGHPDASLDHFGLTAEHVVIVGVGNVALDVARILCRTPEEMRATDVPEHVIETLSSSQVREIRIVGRRGLEHAKFSARELAELHGLTDTELIVDRKDLPVELVDLPPTTRRMVSTLAGFDGCGRPGARRTVRFDFGRRPTRVMGDPVSAVALSGADADTPTEAVPADLLIRSVGYRATPFPGLPFDVGTATVPNQLGRVVLENDVPLPGVYVVGWIKRGPSGVIGTNRVDAVETVATLLADLHQSPRHISGDVALPPDSIGWDGWNSIDTAEHQYGATLSRGRVKLHEHATLLKAAGIQRPEEDRR